MFSVHTTSEELKSASITDHFGFVFRGNTFLQGHRFQSFQAPLPKCLLSARKRKPGLFKFLWFEERLRKAPFLCRLVMMVGLNVEIELRFQIHPK